MLIDADNIPARYANAILKEVARFGEPALRRVYGDWGSDRMNAWRSQVRDLGLVSQQETANTTGKNASDIGLVIDAMDILHTRRFDGFVLVSSDSDFTALANRLREDGVEVIGIGEDKAPRSLRNVCNRFILIENIIKAEEPDPEPPKPPKPKAKKQAEPELKVEPEPQKRPPSAVVPLVRRAMVAIDPDGDWYALGQLGHQISRLSTDFDPRTYGSAKLSDVLSKGGGFDLRQVDGTWQARKKT